MIKSRIDQAYNVTGMGIGIGSIWLSIIVKNDESRRGRLLALFKQSIRVLPKF